ncbi:MAG: hypothetical protein KJ051_09255 [Thermoleophilia bacterium]|nr:hypothetical protein [Thermoleophilia bacterium]
MEGSAHGPDVGQPPPRRERRPPPRRRRGRRATIAAAAGLIVAAIVFFAGLVVGRALEDAPKPGGEQTIVRTLVPATIGPAVTVTVTEP